MAALCIHTNTALTVYSSDVNTVKTVPFPQTAVSDLEVVDPVVYARTVTDQLHGTPHAHTQTILVLSDAVCFTIKATNDPIDSQMRKLPASVPFARIEAVVVHTADATYIVAVNRDLYEASVAALAANGYAVSLVVPWSAIVREKLSQGGELDMVTVRRILDSEQALKQYAYPLDAALPEDQTGKNVHQAPKSEKKRSLSVGWILFGAAALLYAGGMLWYMTRQ